MTTTEYDAEKVAAQVRHAAHRVPGPEIQVSDIWIRLEADAALVAKVHEAASELLERRITASPLAALTWAATTRKLDHAHALEACTVTTPQLAADATYEAAMLDAFVEWAAGNLAGLEGTALTDAWAALPGKVLEVEATRPEVIAEYAVNRAANRNIGRIAIGWDSL